MSCFTPTRTTPTASHCPVGRRHSVRITTGISNPSQKFGRSSSFVQISLSSVGFVPLYGANLQHKVLALFTPQDQLTAVALYLNSQWYSVEDILKTTNSRREGLIKVRSVGERIVLYVLNRIVYRTNEMGSGEMPFLCHSENDYAKIFWKDGQAVGFYSVKPKGSVCNNYLRQGYCLPVMDSIFVRKAHRGKGYGLQILEDFVDSFNDDDLGLKYPLSPAMTNVCRRYLDRYPADVDLFWEVEGTGGPYQRTRVAHKLNSRPLTDTRKGGHGEEKGQNGDLVEGEVEESEETCLNNNEEVIVVNKHHKVTGEIDPPISTRTRSSEHRWRKRVRDDDEEAEGVESQPEKINRMEIAEEEKKECVPADGVESVPEAPAETLVSAVDANSEQDDAKEEEEDESAIQNGTAGKEKDEMEVGEEAKGNKAPVQKTVDIPEEPAAEQPEAAPVAEDNQEMEVDPIAHVQPKGEDASPAEEERVAESEQKGGETREAPAVDEERVAPTAHEEQEVALAAEEKQDVSLVPKEKQEVAPVSEEEQGGVPAANEELEGTLAIEEEEEEEEEVAPEAKEEQEGVSAAKEKHDETAVVEEEQEGSPSVEEEQESPPSVEEEKVAPEMEKNEVSSAAAEEEQEVAPDTEDNEVDPSAEETSSLDAEGEQGQEEAMDIVNDTDEVTDTSEQSFKEDERQPSGDKKNTLVLEEEEEEAAQKDELDEEGEEKDVDEASDFSRVLWGTRTKAVPPTSKRASKRLSKMTLGDDEEEQGETKVVEDKGMSTEEEKVTTEEEAEHSSEEEEQVQDPPAIDKRVLRGKTKTIQNTQRTRSKRRGKM
ncbi:soluble lamin-associated protein of 75 kDa-like isoform X3 [Neoarius graeffei]|uniref:soluble lamin-associated protein of 75 kDa-like isoform X3 n=1 Tax=Neoarius graeffei TaxID=443677 RepID=UPI00298BDD26|nr:soluble lamin-associated protein of 75 kDa-like isoform X3 [Neoarius graeffei]